MPGQISNINLGYFLVKINIDMKTKKVLSLQFIKSPTETEGFTFSGNILAHVCEHTETLGKI